MFRISGWGKVLALNVYTHSMEQAAPMGWRQTPFKSVLTESQHRPWCGITQLRLSVRLYLFGYKVRKRTFACPLINQTNGFPGVVELMTISQSWGENLVLYPCS